MKVWLTKEEVELVREGLTMKCNYIESGNPILSGADAAQIQRDNLKCGRPSSFGPKALSFEQMELVVGIRKLINKLTLYEIRSNTP